MERIERKELADAFGLHRVMDKAVVLPQGAERLDNQLPIFSNEILIDVERLNIDAASFVQMENETSQEEQKIAQIILENTRNRGKQHNAVTGSGGMLVGTVKQIGSNYKGGLRLKVGDRIATLVSLTLTPLHINKIKTVHTATHQVAVSGHAVLFESGIAAKLPKNLPENVAMAVFDVAGAPATVAGLARPGQTVVILGAGGKAGLLSCVAARQKIGKSGKLIAIEPFEKAAKDLEKLGVCDHILRVDATHPVLVHSSVAEVTRGRMGEIVVNVASVPNTEMSTILCARRSSKKKSKILFFSMATSFTRVALGAEGIAADADLILGNGYYPNHAATAIGLVEKNRRLKEIFLSRYSR